jgi:hypothetical protein
VSDEQKHVPSNSVIDCLSIYGLWVCRGDIVQVFPRSRSLASIVGRVVSLTPSSVVLENEENTVAIRISEIKMIRIPKFKKE